ncbi:LexA family protein [Phnomibacter sp. MR]|uniref:LexA family protein n=1 Tax=Phnomibacter sp. MR TaxID=3042318 RepID=UPI003A805154
MVQEKIQAKSIIDKMRHKDELFDNQHFIVKANCLAAAGFLPGDELIIDRKALPVPGAIVLLEMDGKFLLRRLAQQHHGWQILPLHSGLAAFEWPFYQPLPLVGVVKKIIRTVAA